MAWACLARPLFTFRSLLVNSLALAISFTAMELERVKATPFYRLQRKELKARKLLGRFNDDRQDLAGKAVRMRFSVRDHFASKTCSCPVQQEHTLPYVLRRDNSDLTSKDDGSAFHLV